MPPERTIFAGEIWAYREKPSKPLQRVLIIDTGSSTYSDIRSKLLDVEGQPVVIGKKIRYPVKWEQVEEYVAQQRAIAERQEVEAKLDGLREADRLRKEREEFEGLRVSVPELLAVAMGRIYSPRVAFSLEAAAEECGVSTQFLRAFISKGQLKAHYANTKLIILADDLKEWIERLPTERE